MSPGPTFGQEAEPEVKGIPAMPGEAMHNEGHIENEVNLYNRDGIFRLPLYEFQGRGNAKFTIGLHYFTNIQTIKENLNTENQASWVGMGWGLDIPHIWGDISAEYENNEFTNIDIKHTLVWDGVRDSFIQSGTWTLTQKKYWKVTKTTDANGYVDTFTLTDMEGTKYTFGHRRETVLTLYDEEEELRDWDGLIPYQWDLTEIEDVTGQNSLTFYWDDIDVEFEEDPDLEYTEASYLDYIKDDASDRIVDFVREDRDDYPRPGDIDDLSEVFEKKRLQYFALRPSTSDTSRLIIFDFDYASYYGSGYNSKKLQLGSVQRMNPSGGGLPAWDFTHRSSDPNNGALETITLPEGGSKKITYSSGQVNSIILDRGMGASADTTTFTYLGNGQVKVTPPGGVGYTQYDLKSSSWGNSRGILDLVRVYNQSNSLVEKFDYTPEDTTIIHRRYSLIRHVVYQGSDSLITDTEYHYSSTAKGQPWLIREKLRPFQPRGYTAGLSDVDTYWRSRRIWYAFENYSAMNENGTHQLTDVWKEIVREETRSTANGNKCSPLSATWTTFAQYNSTYYGPAKVYLWVGDGTASDTTITADPPGNTSEKVIVREIVSCDAYGHVTQEKDGEDRITKYYYGDNSSNLNNSATGLDHRLLTGIRRLAGASDDNNNDLITKTDWNGNVGLKTDEEDENNSKTYFTHDNYYRPTHIKNHSSTDIQRTDYSYSRDQSGTGNFDATKPNYERIVQFFTYGGSTDSTHTTRFTDGFGRKIQTQRRNDTNDIIQSWGFYRDGALRAEYTPYDISNATHAYHNTASYGSRDSTKFEYESDPRRRPSKSIFPTMDTATRPQTTTTFGISSISGHKFLTRTLTDENSVAHKEWLNEDGTAFKETVGGSYAARTLRDVRGLVVMIMPPRASESTSSPLRTDITQGLFGREIERGEPDQGTTKIVYDRSLLPIWVQEAADASGNDFWTTIYDNFWRPTRIGLEKDSSSSWYTRVPTTPTSSYGSEADEWRKKYTYDSDQFGSGTTYPKGRLTKIEGNYDTDSTVEYYEYYQYSREGWITKQRQYISGAISRDTEYEYDTGGRLRKIIFADAQNSEEFFIWYDPDSAGRLYKIYSHTSNSKPGTATAEYAYNARGQVTQEKLGGAVQQVDFTYNARGVLTKINDPGSLGSDRFAMQLGYDAKVTGGPSTGWSAENNGNISQLKWVNTKFSSTAYYYTFGYDSRDQLTKADCSNNSWDVSSYSYDNNGNLSGLNRGTAWTYNYDGDEANTNRLDDITNLTSDDNWDYDLNGRQTKDTNGSFSSSTYHFPGAAFNSITMSGGTLYMEYNKDNRRVQKIISGGTYTNYIRDISGQVLAVFNGTTISERYVWGFLGLVSIVKGNNSSPTRYYTITDHLGSVRSVTNTSGTAVAGYDYYPYGKTLRSSINSGADSRFMLQGKEFDTELNLDLYYFEARFYRPDIGRFAAPDPMKQGWSYYSFTGNNPIRFTDPSGMFYSSPDVLFLSTSGILYSFPGIFSLPTSGMSNSSSEEIDDRDDNERGYLYEAGEEIYIEEFDLGTNGVTEKNPHLQPGSIFTFANGDPNNWAYYERKEEVGPDWLNQDFFLEDRNWLDPWDYHIVGDGVEDDWFREFYKEKGVFYKIFKKWYKKNRKYFP